jgi:hypothetical protein
MTATVPEWVSANATVAAWFVPAIVASSGAPTAAEITAGVKLTCYLPTPWEGITAEQAKGEQTRMCLNESFEVLGKTSYSVADMTYTYVPQELGTPGEDGNEVYEELVPGTLGFVVVRYGLAHETAHAAAQIVDSLAVQVGTQNKATTGSDEFAPLVVTSGFSARGIPKTDLAILA